MKPITITLWCFTVVWGFLSCAADGQQSGSLAGNNSTIVLNSTDPLLPHEHETSTSQDTNRRRFILFRGRRRRAVKRHTVAFAKKLEETRQVLLDRMAAVSFNLINNEHDAAMSGNSTLLLSDGNENDIMPQSDLTLPNRSIYVVTTAALPWRTGTAVNPLLRAAYLSRRLKFINSETNSIEADAIDDVNLNDTICNASQSYKERKQYVTLVIPWLELEEDRNELYGPNHTFSTSQEQEAYIRQWLKNDANMPGEADPINGLKILFYPARYHSGLKSIFAMGDICAVLRNQTKGGDLSSAVCILEEPEHLNWYRAPGEGWTKVFSYVIGIIHTNYIEYASTQFHGLWTAPAIQVMSSAMVRAYCHKVIKLSGVLQTYAPEKEVVENVHGVREDFIREGRRRAVQNSEAMPLDEESEGQVYYIGKILWAKGFDLMLELQKFYHECTGKYFAIDIIGGGPDLEEIKRAFHGRRNSNAIRPAKSGRKKATNTKTPLPKSLYELRKKPIPSNFLGPMDHATLTKYKVFVNPSISEVLCTTTFEALAMGKWAIIPIHESNKFFFRFPNCLGGYLNEQCQPLSFTLIQ